MKKIAIQGAGGFGREVLQIIQDINEIAPTWEFLGWIDDANERVGQLIHGFPVVGNPDWLQSRHDVDIVVAIGGAAARQRAVGRLKTLGHQRFATLVHPRAWVGRNVKIGEGTVVAAGTHITTDVTIGTHVILNLCCTVGHDTRIDDFCTLNPATNVSGNVHIQAGCEFGTNCTIIPGVTVGEWSIVGAATLLNKTIPPNVTAVGIPGKPIKERVSGWHLTPPESN